MTGFVENQSVSHLEFRLQVGPIEVVYELPQHWSPAIEETWKGWTTLTHIENGVIPLHQARIHFHPEPKRFNKRIKLQLQSWQSDQSVWNWDIDPRYFLRSNEAWLDWRGHPGDRRTLIDLALRNVLAQMVIDHNAILMHASAVKLDGKAFVAPGHSGKGKTTFFQMLGGYDAGHLHEDLVFILNHQVYALPCRSSTTTWDMPKPIYAKLHCIVALERGEKLKVRPLVDPAKKLSTISSACVFPLKSWGASESERGFEVLTELAAQTEVRAATFGLETNPQELRQALLLR